MRTRNRKRKGETPWHDRGYKRLFSHPTTVEELLRGFLQEDWTERLDFSTLETVGNDFVAAGLRERHSDLIWRLRFRDEKEGCRLDLDRPDLDENRIATLFRLEAAKSSEDFPLLTRELAGHISREEDPELRRVLNDWWISLVHRTFPGVIISETLDLTEAPMLEETAKEWKRQAETAGMRELLLQQLSARFGRLPAGVRLKVQQITSKQELRRLGRKFAVAKSLRELGL